MGCTSEGSSGHCDGAGPNPTVIVHLGDGNDLAESNNDHAAGHSVQFYGEDGDDDLQSQGSSDLLDGGPGNDRLQPDDHDAGSGDVVVGGPGIDSLWLDTAIVDELDVVPQDPGSLCEAVDRRRGLGRRLARRASARRS